MKEKNKGVTLVALMITVIVLLILAAVSIAGLTGENGILSKTKEAKTQTEIADEKEAVEIATMHALGKGRINERNMAEELDNKPGKGKYSLVSSEQKVYVTFEDSKRTYLVESDGEIEEFKTSPVLPSEVGKDGNNFTRSNGKVDVQFLKGTTYIPGEANKPLIDKDNMVPVNWNGSNWVVTDEENWDYSYGETEATKKWANVMLRDTLVLENMSNAQVKNAEIEEMNGKKVTKEGSMFVWIPRYAYKITYYGERDSYKTGAPVGYSDARGIVDTEGKTPTGMAEPVTSVSIGDYYRPHPAFEDGSKTGYTQGEWDKKITGIWIGKFDTSEKSGDKITVRPNTNIYVSDTIGTFYTEAKKLGIANSHMVKNSEWGAMAYLSVSKYGVNGAAVTGNKSSKMLTAQGQYITRGDMSTTNNIYGIYDTVGGASDCTAGYVADQSSSWGNSFASMNPENESATNNKKTSTKYETVYEMAETNTYEDNYRANENKKFGDGIIETSSAGTGTTAWNKAFSDFVGESSNYNYPFFDRGDNYISTNKDILSYGKTNGEPWQYRGFRVCAIVE